MYDIDHRLDQEMKKRFDYAGSCWLDDDGNSWCYTAARRFTLQDMHPGLLPMTGSPKQRAWAEDLRLEFIYGDTDTRAKSIAMRIGKSTNDSAAAWINNRNSLRDWLLTRA